jgi:glycosyltransferase involved in cell wall biosynthesis
VVISEAAALVETAGDAGLSFDPLDVGDMARSLTLALDDAGLRARMRALGLERARFFSWDQVAARVLAVLVEAARTAA